MCHTAEILLVLVTQRPHRRHQVRSRGLGVEGVQQREEFRARHHVLWPPEQDTGFDDGSGAECLHSDNSRPVNLPVIRATKRYVHPQKES